MPKAARPSFRIDGSKTTALLVSVAGKLREATEQLPLLLEAKDDNDAAGDGFCTGMLLGGGCFLGEVATFLGIAAAGGLRGAGAMVSVKSSFLEKMRNEENEGFLYFFKHVEILLNTIGIDRQKF